MIRLALQDTSGALPTSTYKLFDGNNWVGFIQIRHRPSHSQGMPANFASHIYYEIKPEYRNQGYGKKILGLGLNEGRKINLKEITVTCYEDNAASKKIIEDNGGVLIDSHVFQNDQKKFLKYIFKME